jgi:histone-binding protein RBBP4
MAGTSAAPTNPSREISDVLEERLIDAEYKVWKKNTPYLYDFVMTHSLEWPSLTCQWLPTVKNAGDHASEHTLLLGTHTTGEQNYLMLASCNLPKEDTVVDLTEKKNSSSNKDGSNNNKEGRENNKGSAAKATPHYDEEKKELGGFGHANSNVGKIEIRMKVKHEGEVNRARYMPQNHFIVASRGPNPEVYIFNLSRHPSFPSADDASPFSPQGVCIGHTKEGYGMAWSPHQEGYLLTASEDSTVNLWDVNAATGSKQPPGAQIMPVTTLKGHLGGVEDVDWHRRDPNMVGSVGDDQTVRLWDVREKNKVVHVVRDAHEGDINCIAFNPINEFVLATGSADKSLALWDLRNLKS